MVLVSSSAEALRIARPLVLRFPYEEHQTSQLNKFLEDIWHVQDGRYEMDVETTSKTGANNGEMWMVDPDIEYMVGDTTYLVSPAIYGDIYTKDNAVATKLNSAANTQITVFTNNGPSKNTTPNHTTDDITIIEAGSYLVTGSVALNNNAAQSHEVRISLFINNGATEIENVHAHRNLSGGSGDKGSISLSGIATFSVGDTAEFWANTDSASDRSVTFSDITLSIVRLGP